MPSRSHHTCCVTDEPEAVITFLREVLGLEVALEFKASGTSTAAILSWPEGTPDTRAWMLGGGSAGLVEVLEIPEEIRDTVQPGIALVSFATPDLEERVETATRLGFEMSDIDRSRTDNVDLSGAAVVVGGVRFELVRFN